MDATDIQTMITKELASKVVSALPDEQKNMIIAEAVKDILARELRSSDYKISGILREYALAYANEYAQTPEIQAELKRQAKADMNEPIKDITYGQLYSLFKRRNEALSDYISDYRPAKGINAIQIWLKNHKAIFVFYDAKRDIFEFRENISVFDD